MKKEDISVNHDKYHYLIRYSWIIHKGYAKASNNNDMLDNYLVNLRESNPCHNSQNRTNRSGYFSKYKGHKNSHLANIDKDKVTYSLGLFKTKVETSLAYNIKALELYGPNAKLNVI